MSNSDIQPVGIEKTDGCFSDIAAAIRTHPLVTGASVSAQSGVDGRRLLVAHVILDSTAFDRQAAESSARIRRKAILEWRSVYDLTYRRALHSAPDFPGWMDSYSGKPIANSEMIEFFDAAAARIASFQPRRILELGCGHGLLAKRLAPSCDHYLATDFSASAIGRLAASKASDPDLRNVELIQRDASDFSGVSSASYDTVVLNSVIQYFPDAEYLVDVICHAARAVQPGGRIFLGDLRNLNLLDVLHRSIQLNGLAATSSIGDLKEKANESVLRENELLVAPEFIYGLRDSVQGISRIDIQLKRGFSENELTRYRYDAIIAVGAAAHADIKKEVVKIPYNQSITPTAFAEAARKDLSRRYFLVGVPNSRLERDYNIEQTIALADQSETLSSLLAQIDSPRRQSVHPESFWSLNQDGWEAVIGWNAESKDLCFDVELRLRSDSKEACHRRPIDSASIGSANLRDLATNPLSSRLRREIARELRAALATKFPPHMIPETFIVARRAS